MAAARLAEVECLRGLAIALVVAHHLHGFLYGGGAAPLAHVPEALRAVLLGGHTGVSLFFVLSGFLLSRPFLAEARGGRRVRVAGYAARRVLRVMPLYVVVVLATTASPLAHAT